MASRPGVVANDVVTEEDALIIRRGLAGILDPARIVGVATGACPHQAVREDPSLNLAAIERLAEQHPDIDLVFIESGGDNLTLTFSPLLARLLIYVMDVAGGDKTPRKQGAGMIQSDLLVINKADLAPYVGADLAVMERDAARYRSGPAAVHRLPPRPRSRRGRRLACRLDQRARRSGCGPGVTRA